MEKYTIFTSKDGKHEILSIFHGKKSVIKQTLLERTSYSRVNEEIKAGHHPT